jgi:hypothetical protein
MEVGAAASSGTGECVIEVRTTATSVDEDVAMIGEEVGPSSKDDETSAGVSTTAGTSRSPPLGMAVARVLHKLLA